MSLEIPDCPKCAAYRQIAKDYKDFNDTLKEQCAKQAADLKELRRKLSTVRKALTDENL